MPPAPPVSNRFRIVPQLSNTITCTPTLSDVFQRFPTLSDALHTSVPKVLHHNRPPSIVRCRHQAEPQRSSLPQEDSGLHHRGTFGIARCGRNAASRDASMVRCEMPRHEMPGSLSLRRARGYKERQRHNKRPNVIKGIEGTKSIDSTRSITSGRRRGRKVVQGRTILRVVIERARPEFNLERAAAEPK